MNLGIAPRVIYIVAMASMLLVACGGTDDEGSETTATANDQDAATDVGEAVDDEADHFLQLGNVTEGLATGSYSASIAADSYAKYGLEFEYRNFNSNTSAITAAVLADDIDVGSVASNALADAVREGADLVAIAQLTIPPVAEIGLSTSKAEELGVSRDDPLEDRVEALRGLTIAAPPAGSAGANLLRQLLIDHGIDPETDVSIVPGTTDSVVSGLQQGNYDAAAWSNGVLEFNYIDGSAVQILSYPAGDVPAFNDFLMAVAFARRDHVEADPEIYEAFANGLADAHKAIADGDPEVREAVKQRFFPDLDDEIFETTWSEVSASYPEDIRIPQETWDTTLAMLSDWSGNDYSDVTFDRAVADFAKLP